MPTKDVQQKAKELGYIAIFKQGQFTGFKHIKGA